MQTEKEMAVSESVESQNQSKELTNKLRTLEAEMAQLQEDLANGERAKKAAEKARDDLMEEMEANANNKCVHFSCQQLFQSSTSREMMRRGKDSKLQSRNYRKLTSYLFDQLNYLKIIQTVFS